MSKNNIKKYWIIERHYEHSKEKKLLAIFDSRTSSDKIIFAMKTLMMSECDSFKEILNIKELKKNNPKQEQFTYMIIGGNDRYYKAPYKAWITDFNTETGEYTDIETKRNEFLDLVKK